MIVGGLVQKEKHARGLESWAMGQQRRGVPQKVREEAHFGRARGTTFPRTYCGRRSHNSHIAVASDMSCDALAKSAFFCASFGFNVCRSAWQHASGCRMVRHMLRVNSKLLRLQLLVAATAVMVRSAELWALSPVLLPANSLAQPLLCYGSHGFNSLAKGSSPRCYWRAGIG